MNPGLVLRTAKPNKHSFQSKLKGNSNHDFE